MSVKSSTPLVVQHNALVNARFNFTALEMHLFVAMLLRINRTDSTFQVCRIPVRELSPDSTSKNLYNDVDAMTKNMATRALHLEVLGPDGKRVKNPDKRNRPLMARCDYISSQGLVEARFNDDLADYLLDLRTQFTQAQVEQLLRIRSPAAHRIYWLVKEYAQQGKTEREIELQELRDVLGLTTEYEGRFDHFRVRVLERAQQELAKTDLPITMEYVRQHKQVRRIRFLFPGATPELPSSTQVSGWQAAVLAAGVAVRSLPLVQEQLDAGTYDEGYIAFVLKTIRAQVTAGKVKKEGGAVFKALVEGYLLPEYRKAATKAPARAAHRTVGLSKRDQQRLASELEDNQRTLRWILNEAPESTYPTEKRQAAAAELEQKIAGLKAQLSTT